MSAFRSPAFRWLWSSSVASYAGSGMHRTATAWLALDSGALAVGMVLAANFLPMLLFGLPAGTLADRYKRQVLLAGVGLAAVPIMLGFSWIASQPSIAVWQLVALAFAVGTLNVVDIPARQSLAMATVPPADGPNAVASNALAGRLCTALGALLAGALIPTFGARACYLVVTLTYTLAACLALCVRTSAQTQTQRRDADTNYARAIGDAVRLVADVPAVRTLVVIAVVCEIFGFSIIAATPVFSRDVLNSGAEGLGTLNAAQSLGGTVAIVLLSLVPARFPREPMLGGIFVVFGISVIALAATHDLYISAAALLLLGGCMAAWDVLQQTLMQLSVNDHQRGRAAGLWVVSIGSAPVGHLEMGALISILGAPLSLLINGSLVVVSAVVLLMRVPHYRLFRRRHAATDRPRPDTPRADAKPLAADLAQGQTG